MQEISDKGFQLEMEMFSHNDIVSTEQKVMF